MDFKSSYYECFRDSVYSGPIGINWLRVTGDLYAAQKALDKGFMNNCPVYVEDGTLYLPYKAK